MSPRRARLLASASILLVAACSGGSGDPDASSNTICNDQFDNDGDGSTDFPADPGCSSEFDTDETNDPIAMCSDTRDNDGDGKIDFPNDPGCFSQLQNSETDDCPSGPTCPDCANGVDDNNDTQVDFPQDDGCSSAADRDEFATDPNACGAGLIVTRIMTPTVTGTLPGAPSNLMSATCGGAGGEVAYELVVDDPSVVVITTDLPQTTVNTVIYLRSSCLVPSTEIDCNDDIGAGVEQSSITASLAPGLYYLIVDGRTAGTAGPFTLQVDYYAGEGVACTDQSECGPGLQCRIPQGGSEMICTDPVCSDGVDDDGDSFDDYPDDPGCGSPGDFDEIDDCPSGPTCPDCANDLDDDGDTQIDYPDDGDCLSAAQPVEGCSAEQDPILVQDDATTNGSTTGASNDFFPSCDFSSGGPDVVTLVNLPAMQTFHVDLAGTPFDAVLVIHDQTCANELGCADTGVSGGEVIELNNLAAGTYAVVVDGYFNASGNFSVNVSGTIAPLAACDGVLATAGVIQCGPGYACTGGICLGSLECNNGMDDDGDGDSDYPNDPGCGGPNDTTELDDCPAGANCPACGNGDDDDGDFATDYPADPDCASAADDSEDPPACSDESDPVLDFLGPQLTGSTVGATDDFFLSCDFGFGSAPDLVALANLPHMQSLHVDTFGSAFNMVIALRDPTCTTDVACNDFFFGEEFDVNNLPAGEYSVVIDGSNGASGNFVMNLSGVIAPLGECDGALAASGAIACPAGYSCTGGVCLGTNTCNNGMNDDGDSYGADYPLDPGCTSPTDNSEGDTCPSGGSCPDCSNQMDDDGDGDTDYPDDASCIAASGGSEGTCGQDSGGVTQVVIPLYSGTTIGGIDDFTPTCAFNAPSQDRAFALNLPVPVQNLRIDTIGSTFDTVLSVMDAACTGTLACDDQSGGGFGTSLINMTNVPAGSYGILVDGWTGDGPYMLNVRGSVAPGTACTAPLFSTGVLVCPANHICTAGTCQPL